MIMIASDYDDMHTYKNVLVAEHSYRYAELHTKIKKLYGYMHYTFDQVQGA